MEDHKKFAYQAYIVGEAIYARRKSKLLTQQQLAEDLDIDVKQLGNLENGVNFPSFVTAIKLREQLDISLDELIDQINQELKK